MATYQISPPSNFNFNPEGWTAWIRNFDRFRNAGGLKDNPDKEQVATLIYTIGMQGDAIMQTFTWENDGDSEKYEVVKKQFTNHFIVHRNLVFESGESYKKSKLKKKVEKAHVVCTEA